MVSSESWPGYTSPREIFTAALLGGDLGKMCCYQVITHIIHANIVLTYVRTHDIFQVQSTLDGDERNKFVGVT